MNSQADDDDTIAVIFSGHGSRSSGQSGWFETYTGSNFYDYELASYLDDSDAFRIFVFLDFCKSGCFLDNLENMPNNDAVFATSACRYDGDSAAPDDLEMGAWTYHYLDVYKDHPSWYQETIYSQAYDDWMDYWYEVFEGQYPDEWDRPQKYDGDTNSYFPMNPP